MRRLVLAGILAALIAAPASAAEPVCGRSLAQWQVALDRWTFSYTATEIRKAGSCFTHDTGAVVFLGEGGFDEHVIDTHCTVPSGRYLLLSGPQMTCTDVTPLGKFPRTAAGLRRCARHWWPRVADRHPRLLLDGQPISFGPIMRSAAFRFTMPAHDNLFGVEGVRTARAATIGRPTLVGPLTPGTHTLIQGIHYRVTHNYVAVFHLEVV